jgi:hypothetical protein
MPSVLVWWIPLNSTFSYVLFDACYQYVACVNWRMGCISCTDLRRLILDSAIRWNDKHVVEMQQALGNSGGANTINAVLTGKTKRCIFAALK